MTVEERRQRGRRTGPETTTHWEYLRYRSILIRSRIRSTLSRQLWHGLDVSKPIRIRPGSDVRRIRRQTPSARRCPRGLCDTARSGNQRATHRRLLTSPPTEVTGLGETLGRVYEYWPSRHHGKARWRYSAVSPSPRPQSLAKIRVLESASQLGKTSLQSALVTRLSSPVCLFLSHRFQTPADWRA